MARPTSALGPGNFNRRVRLDKRALTSDSMGNQEGAWATQFTRPAVIEPLRGGEGILADRLAGLGPAIIILRYDEDTKLITPDWRAVEVAPECDAPDRIYAIKDARDMENDRRHVTLLVELGGAA